ncbi:MAG: hypothetical protein PV344_00240 [Anaplasma sp.]|nr:hypothetical protein [Anaplasma sp.]
MVWGNIFMKFQEGQIAKTSGRLFAIRTLLVRISQRRHRMP